MHTKYYIYLTLFLYIKNPEALQLQDSLLVSLDIRILLVI